MGINWWLWRRIVPMSLLRRLSTDPWPWMLLWVEDLVDFFVVFSGFSNDDDLKFSPWSLEFTLDVLLSSGGSEASRSLFRLAEAANSHKDCSPTDGRAMFVC
jgi:hypothetical protein